MKHPSAEAITDKSEPHRIAHPESLPHRSAIADPTVRYSERAERRAIVKVKATRVTNVATRPGTR
jgi:hypothetical protein